MVRKKKQRPGYREEDEFREAMQAGKESNQRDEQEEVIEDFTERQHVTAGSDQLPEDISQHHSKSPDLSAGDLDATWADTDLAGEEWAGGTVSTPDQDIVGELGEAVGLIYDDDEELDAEGRMIIRDRKRWELDPASADFEEEEFEEHEDEDLETSLEELNDEEAPEDEDLLDELEEEDLFEDELDEEDEDLDEFLDDLLEDDE